MKQVLQSYRTGELWLAEVPVPAGRAGGLVVRTANSLVSAGTERMILELAKKSLIGKARARPDLVKQVLRKIRTEGFAQTLTKVSAKLDTPIALGYSCAGTVEEVGARVPGFARGDRVACGGAGYAAHSEYNFIPKNLCVKIPDEVGFEDASFTTVGAIAMQGVRQADLRLGERAVVVGLGLLGLLTVQLLKASGCAVFGFDPDPDRCRLAQDLGAEAAVSGELTEATAAFTDGHGADAVIITAATRSNQPLQQAAEAARTKGRVVVVGLVGMDLPRDPFYRKELDLRLSMSYGPGRYDPSYEEGGVDYPFGYVRWTERRNMRNFLDLVAAGQVTPSRLVSHRFPLDRALDGYALLEGCGPSGAREPYLGVILRYPDNGAALPPSRKVELRARARPGRVGVGFLGAGNFARAVLLPRLKSVPYLDLVGLCNVTSMSAAETAKKYDFAFATTDPDQIMGDERVHAVFIATRHDTHAPLAAAALAAGKHVFLEKPLAIRPEELELFEHAPMNGDPGGRPCLMVGFNRRFSPHASALREAFAGRGTPMAILYRVNAGVIPRNVWIQDSQTGGGRIVGEVCHFLDFCEFVTGSRAVRVFAACVVTEDARFVAEDSLVATIGYADGSLATIQYLAHGSTTLPKERIELHADGTTAVLDDFRRTTFAGCRRPPVKGRQDKGFDGEIAAFLETVRDGGAWPIPLESMLRTTRAAFAIRDSLRSGTAIPLA